MGLGNSGESCDSGESADSIEFGDYGEYSDFGDSSKTRAYILKVVSGLRNDPLAQNS